MESQTQPRPTRAHNERRVRFLTRFAAATAALATLVFAGAAAQHSQAGGSSGSVTGQDQSTNTFFSGQAPSQSFGAPQASSGGS
jgi:hypothetical protein